jgi:hypothetical protein
MTLNGLPLSGMTGCFISYIPLAGWTHAARLVWVEACSREWTVNVS